MFSYKCSANPSLGYWCSHTKTAHKKIQKGVKPSRSVSQDQIGHLEQIEFKWKDNGYETTFEKQCGELEAFKGKFAHCNVPSQYSDNPSLGYWCSSIRKAYKKVQKGEKTDYDISQDRIERLEKIGFKWKGIDHDEAFETRCSELDAFKSKFVHFTTFPVQYSTNTSLGYWYDNMRSAYSKRYREERNRIIISLKIGLIDQKR